jgi:hypothetical protein
MPILAIATILSTQIPDAAIERSWGPIMRAQHHAGAWTVEVGDQRLTGEWITVVNEPGHHARYFGGKVIHLTSSTGAYCAISLGGDQHAMHCETRDFVNIRLDAHGVDAILAGSALDRYECRDNKCQYYRAGSLTVNARRRTPTLAEAQQLFQRIHQRTIAETLGARVVPGRGLVLRMPYKLETFLGSTATLGKPGISSSEVIEVEATIELTMRGTKVTPRETARYIEDCEVSVHAVTSCSPPPPRQCTRR